MRLFIIVLIIIFLLLITGGFFLFNQQQVAPGIHQSNISPTAGIVKTVQMETAEKYFETFTNCLKNPPEEAADNVSVYCYSQNQQSGKQLSENLQKQEAPVVCGQNPPVSISAIKSTEINDNQALVTVRYLYTKNNIDVTYQMQRENGRWYVENILCPH